MKKRSKVIIDLINNEINIEQAFEALDFLLEDIKDKKIKKWLDNEINGYKDVKDIPSYRILEANIKGNYIAGRFQCKNNDIPLKPEKIKEFTTIKISQPISQIVQFSMAEKEGNGHNLTIPLHPVIAQDISLINGEVISAYKELSIYAFTNLVSKIKTKLLSIFKELEKQYGNLDDYYIDLGDKKKEEKITKSLITIINDNSTHIGDNNSIKESIIGDNNEN